MAEAQCIAAVLVIKTSDLSNLVEKGSSLRPQKNDVRPRGGICHTQAEHGEDERGRKWSWGIVHENEEKQEILQRGGLQSRIQNGPRFFHQILRSQGLGKRKEKKRCRVLDNGKMGMGS